MKKALVLFCTILFFGYAYGQTDDEHIKQNTADRMLKSPDKLTIGGYGQFDYNQPIEGGVLRNGVMDIHRLVLLFAYKFDERASFVSEIEIEHVKEVYVEQAFVNYKIRPWLTLNGGLLLIPMGIINEYHEPPTYNGVERPNVDKYIVPTTWREIGLGLSGQFLSSGISYKLFLVNGFLGSDDSGAKLSGSSLLRSGRQKGAESVFTSPNIAFQLNYNGVPGLSTGFSGYFGKTQSTHRNGIDALDQAIVARADSTVVRIQMLGIVSRYNLSGIGIKGQLITGLLTNTDQYNAFHDSDLGRGFTGYYIELSYDLLHTADLGDDQLTPFVRYESYDTHRKVEAPLVRNLAYDRTDLTFGIGWKPNSGLIYKIDYQIFSNNASEVLKHQINAGIGVWF